MDAGQDVMTATTEIEDDGVQFAELLNLEIMIEKVSATTNEYLIRTLNDKYHLLDHCRALKRYLLLGQVRVSAHCGPTGLEPLLAMDVRVACAHHSTVSWR